ncbi:MAG TPA: invasin domain 3-containing protein [Gemmatimonadales bacterium]
MTRTPRGSRRLLLLASVVALASCGGSDLTLPNEGQPAELAVVRGNGQNGTIGQPLADSLVVRVEDRFGNPVGGVEVTWSPEDGGTVDPGVSTTGADGRAGTQRTLGLQPGTYTTIAAVAQLPDAPAVFTTTAVAATLSLVTQPSASAQTGVPFDRQPVVQLLDQTGAPMPRAGVVVTVQIATGGGSLGGLTGVASDAGGVVTFTDLSIRGSPGTRTLIFAADGFASATSGPVALGVGVAASIAPADGDGQSATVNTAVATAPAVMVRDAEGNPVPGVPVVFRVAAGGGSISGAVAGTDNQGVARVGSWKLGTKAGENRLEARVDGADLEGSPAGFTATGTAGPVSAAQSSLVAAPATITASSGGSFSTVTVTARDEFGNPVGNRAVTLSATGAGNVLTQPEAPTDASGVATGRLSATGAGNRAVSAQIDGLAVDGTAPVTVNPAAPSAGASSASAGNGTAGLDTDIEVRLEDAFGNAVPGQAGKISVQISGANTLTAGPAEDQGGGSYLVRYTPRVAGSDQIAVRVEGAPVAGSPITSRVSPGPADAGASTADVPSVWRVFSNPGPIPVEVAVRDAQGNLRAGLTDEVMVQVDGGTPFPAAANGDGTYSASFLVPRFGKVPVVITVNGREIAGSPFLIDIRFF